MSGVRAEVIHVLHATATIIEVIGVAIIIAGAIVAGISYARSGGTQGWNSALKQFRANFGRAILLGLEFLVAADIIGTMAITPSFQSLGILGLIIAIRTLLSFSPEVEIEGRWPWRRRECSDTSCNSTQAAHGV